MDSGMEKERERESPSGESIIVRTERHALRRADKKQLHVLKERGRNTKCIGINEKAHGEGDVYEKISYSDPQHTHTHCEECDVWGIGENPVTPLGRTARLMSLSLLVLYMLTAAQEVPTTLL